jgi:hypothetical protein
MPPDACWRMFRTMPEVCQGQELAGAVLHAIEHDWLLPTLVDAIPADMPHAVDKLRARRAFLGLNHCTESPDIDRLLAVLEGIPDAWLRSSAGLDLMHQLGRLTEDERHHEPDWQARFRRVMTRAYTRP